MASIKQYLNPGIVRLALCAVVCMLALQTWEAGHSHDSAVAQEACQICASPVDLAPTVAKSLPPGYAGALFLAVEPASAAALSVFFNYLSRGPPAHP